MIEKKFTQTHTCLSNSNVVDVGQSESVIVRKFIFFCPTSNPSAKAVRKSVSCCSQSEFALYISLLFTLVFSFSSSSSFFFCHLEFSLQRQKPIDLHFIIPREKHLILEFGYKNLKFLHSIRSPQDQVSLQIQNCVVQIHEFDSDVKMFSLYAVFFYHS